ncbi:MAG: class I SAM-dependent methyltransferase [Sneathiella sp.]|nr:class I SAM-dependent methyltransferase [Sneathiella sp.]
MSFYANRVFPWILDKTEPKELSEHRTLALQGVSGDVLEIGLGTGGNLPYYPKSIQRLTAVEPSSGMHARAQKRVVETGRDVEWHQTKGEQLPFGDGRFDTVVTTLLLCSVDDVDKVLQETFRVLKPGGHYHFLEHVLSKEPETCKWQHRLNGLHKVVACGCELIKDIEHSIRDSEFDVTEFHEIPLFAGAKAGLDQKIYPYIRGIARKPV